MSMNHNFMFSFYRNVFSLYIYIERERGEALIFYIIFIFLFLFLLSNKHPYMFVTRKKPQKNQCKQDNKFFIFYGGNTVNIHVDLPCGPLICISLLFVLNDQNIHLLVLPKKKKKSFKQMRDSSPFYKVNF